MDLVMFNLQACVYVL